MHTLPSSLCYSLSWPYQQSTVSDLIIMPHHCCGIIKKCCTHHWGVPTSFKLQHQLKLIPSAAHSVLCGILLIPYKRHHITSFFSSFNDQNRVRIYSNPLLTIEEDQHHSNNHINWNLPHQQFIQCYVEYLWYYRRDIRSPVCSHYISITVEYVFISFLKGNIIYLFFILSPPHQDTLYQINLSSPATINTYFCSFTLPTSLNVYHKIVHQKT